MDGEEGAQGDWGGGRGSDEAGVAVDEGGLDLHHMGEDPDAVIDRSVDTGFQFLSFICFHLLEFGCFKLVLTDHQ
jgi:hypothetical protein